MSIKENMLRKKIILFSIATSIGIAFSSSIAIAAPAAADITSQKGITIGAGGKFASWGGAISLTEADAISQSNGKCGFNVSYDMENIGGTSTAQPFKNRLLAAGNVLSEQSMLSLNAGETKQVSTQISLAPGSATLQLSLDVDNNVVESNEKNNLVAIKISMDGKCGGDPLKPTPTQPTKADLVSLKGITVGGAVGGAGGKFSAWNGNLILATADAFLHDGGQCAFNVSYDISNIGTVAAGPSFNNRLYADADVVSQQSGLSLNAGETTQINTQMSLKPGAHTLTLWVDADNHIAESNESNNKTTVKVGLDSNCNATPAPTTPADTTPKSIPLGLSDTANDSQTQLYLNRSQLTLPNASGLFTYKVTLSATLHDKQTSAPLSGINIHFKIGNVDAGSAATNNSGVATINFTVPESLPTGANTLTASAAGVTKNSQYYAPSTATANFDAVKAPTTLTFQIPLPASKIVEEKDTITLKGRLHTNSPEKTGVSNRKIIFLVNGQPIPHAMTNANGDYSINWKVPVGLIIKDFISAQFEGDGHYLSAPEPSQIDFIIKHKQLPPATVNAPGIHIQGIYF